MPNHSRDACRARALPTTQICRLEQKGGRAPKGAILHWPCRAGHGSAPRTMRFREPSASGRARLPALHRGSPRGAFLRRDSVQAALRADERMRALPAPSFALKQSTLHPGRHAGGDDARNARERGDRPRPQEPPSLRDQVCLEITSLTERDFSLVTDPVAFVKCEDISYHNSDTSGAHSDCALVSVETKHNRGRA